MFFVFSYLHNYPISLQRYGFFLNYARDCTLFYTIILIYASCELLVVVLCATQEHGAKANLVFIRKEMKSITSFVTFFIFCILDKIPDY